MLKSGHEQSCRRGQLPLLLEIIKAKLLEPGTNLLILSFIASINEWDPKVKILILQTQAEAWKGSPLDRDLKLSYPQRKNLELRGVLSFIPFYLISPFDMFDQFSCLCHAYHAQCYSVKNPNSESLFSLYRRIYGQKSCLM